MDLNVEQVTQLAPDAASLAAGKKLSAPHHWRNLGQDSSAAWGECQGSALYRTCIAAHDQTYKCSCPSRKFPCKHVLGLMLLVAQSPHCSQSESPPDWVGEWLKRKDAVAARKSPQPVTAPSRDETGQKKRALQRDRRVQAGVDLLTVWLADLVRNGFAGLESQPSRFWEEPASRLVDSQASGLAARVRAMAAIPGSARDWPARLLGVVGRLKLLLHAYTRYDQLDPLLRADIDQAIGWTLRAEELEAHGDVVQDEWTILGQIHEDEERIRAQRTWMLGQNSARMAMVVQFAPGSSPFPEPLFPGTRLRASLAFYPSAYAQRAKPVERHSQHEIVTSAPAGALAIGDFLAQVAAALARQPWLERFGGLLRGVVPMLDEHAQWQLRDQGGSALPLGRRAPWRFLALTGAHPADVACEWDGVAARPLGLFQDGAYFTL